jgi:hypothetical protein
MFIGLRAIAVAAAIMAAAAFPAGAAQSRPTPGDVGPVVGAGAFVIQSCGETGSTVGWTVSRPNPAAVDAGIECPPQRGHVASRPNAFDQTGVWVSDRLGNAGGAADAAVGDSAEVTFTPVPGTTISRLRYWRKVAKTTDDSWHPYVAVNGRSNVLDTCDINGQVACQVGADDWFAADPNPELDRTAYVDYPGLAASSVEVGLTCRPNADNLCGPGYSIPYVEAQLYSIFFTITDSFGPTLSALSGPAWSSTMWLSGSPTLVSSSSDATGVGEVRIYVDGSIAAAVQHSCSYDRPRPCSDHSEEAISVPTSDLPDGTHILQVAARDAAGNETRESRPSAFLVDNAPPVRPTGLTTPYADSSSNAFPVSWALPPDAGSPITAARYQLCQAGACTAPAVAPSTTAIPALSLPSPGGATLRVWLVDQLGHEDPSTAATLSLTYRPAPTPPIGQPTPVPPLTPMPWQPNTTPPKPRTVAKGDAMLRLTTLRRQGRRISVAGTLASRASGRVAVSYRIRLHGRTHIVARKASIRRHAFRVSLTVPRSLAASTAGTITVSYSGDADTKTARRSATLRTKR